jgi:hypothetical protein
MRRGSEGGLIGVSDGRSAPARWFWFNHGVVVLVSAGLQAEFHLAGLRRARTLRHA